MKTPLYHNTDTSRQLDRSSHWRPYARYPTTYEDFEPLFPRNRRKQKLVSTHAAADQNASVESYISNIAKVRLIAALAVIVIIVALMAFA
jgi:hypothetical protein